MLKYRASLSLDPFPFYTMVESVLTLIINTSTFTFAGTDTTSNAVSRILWLLAQHKDAQSRLRAELREAMANSDGDVPHDELVALPYLDAICRETLRL